MSRFSDVLNVGGVYVLFDLDEQALYTGQSKKLRSRLKQHFIRQDSSATADGILDIYDVLRVGVWYEYPHLELFVEDDAVVLERMQPLDILEAAVQIQFKPKWNRTKPVFWAGPTPTLTLDNADLLIGILDSPEEIAVRRQPLERIEAKLLHLLRAVRKARISGASPAVLKALSRHAQELSNHFTTLGGQGSGCKLGRSRPESKG